MSEDEWQFESLLEAAASLLLPGMIFLDFSPLSREGCRTNEDAELAPSGAYYLQKTRTFKGQRSVNSADHTFSIFLHVSCLTFSPMTPPPPVLHKNKAHNAHKSIVLAEDAEARGLARTDSA